MDERRRQEALLERVWLSPLSQNSYMLANKHYSWWPQEEITDSQVAQIQASVDKVDIMFTHDKPLASRPRFNRKEPELCRPNQARIQAVVDSVRPDLLLHGHLHFRYIDQITTNGHVTRVHGLDAEGVNNHASHDQPRAQRNPTSLADVCVLLDLPTMQVTDVLMP
jgi:predicted phosphohydrolase